MPKVVSNFLVLAVVLANALPVMAGPKQFEFRTLIIGAKSSPQQVLNATGIKCGVGARNMQVCNGILKIGSTVTSANIVLTAEGTLQRIYLSLASNDFDDVIPAFREKYGRPDSEKSPTMQNAFGAQFLQSQLTWIAPDGAALHAVRYAGSIDKASISFSTKADREMLNLSGKAKASDL